jgi:hypothetical protein
MGVHALGGHCPSLKDLELINRLGTIHGREAAQHLREIDRRVRGCGCRISHSNWSSWENVSRSRKSQGVEGLSLLHQCFSANARDTFARCTIVVSERERGLSRRRTFCLPF